MLCRELSLPFVLLFLPCTIPNQASLAASILLVEVALQLCDQALTGLFQLTTLCDPPEVETTTNLNDAQLCACKIANL